MLKPQFHALACLASTMALLSCAAPKAIVVIEEPPVSATETKAVPAMASEPAAPEMPDDGIRLPDMLGLPDEGELRSASTTPGNGIPESGAVIARPPTKP
jgi:hypothetical protein